MAARAAVLWALWAGRSGAVPVSECVTLAAARRERPTETALLARWNELDCEQLPDRPTEVFRAIPQPPGAALEMVEREGVKVPRYVLQQECDRHQQALIKAECLEQLFSPDGAFDRERVDWDACATRMRRPPRFRWEQLRCDELVPPSPLAEWAIRSVAAAKRAREGKTDNEIALEEAAAAAAAADARDARDARLHDDLEGIKAEARASAERHRDWVAGDGTDHPDQWLPDGDMVKGFEFEL